MARTTYGLMAAGTMPKRTSEVANCAFVDAMQISHADARPMPPPSAAPCTRAMVGVLHSEMVRNSAASRRASSRLLSNEAAPWRLIQFRSAPAEKLLPSPASTIARTAGSASSRRNASVSSAIKVSSNALWSSGRLIHTQAHAPRRSIFRLLMRTSHAEDAELRRQDRRVQRGRERQAEDATRLRGVDHAVVPQARTRVVRMPLRFVLRADRRLERRFLVGAPLPAAGLDAVALDGRQHAGRLFATHHADARVGPGPQKARRVRAAAHAVVAGTEAAADEDRQLGHLGGGDGRDHLRAVLGDAGILVLAAHHEAADVLQEEQRHAARGAQLDEVRALLSHLAEQDAVVGNDAHRHAVQAREAGDQRRAVARLELVQA